jgi:hypothetical protein
MEILVAGEGLWPWYEEACHEGFIENGHSSQLITWAHRFWTEDSASGLKSRRGKMTGVQDRLKLGPILRDINQLILRQVAKKRPDVVFFHNCRHVFPSTVRELQTVQPRPLLIHFANDNPYSKNASYGRWRLLRKTVPFYDKHFVYRPANLLDFTRAGAKSVGLLPPYWFPRMSKNFRRERTAGGFTWDVAFGGHYEPDGRREVLETLAESGLRVRVTGGGWRRALDGTSSPLLKFGSVEPSIGDSYNELIGLSRISLCFFSSLNEDVYTRRNFEIPAMGGAMLSQHSEEITRFFSPETEARYFKTLEEIPNKVSELLSSDSEREAMAARSTERLHRDRHTNKDRMATVLEKIDATS